MTVSPSDRRRALMALWATPILFSTNIVIGRAAVGEVEPFTLAFLRWLIAGAVLAALAHRGLDAHRAVLRAEWRWLLLLGFLGMGLCGGAVYYALRFTTATNSTLIYTTAPLLIVLLDWLWRGTPIGRGSVAGIVLGFLGVAVIVAEGSLARLATLHFNGGDLIIALSTVAWAVYSLILKRPPLQALPMLPFLAAIACSGALMTAPPALVEIAATGRFPVGWAAWGSIGAIVILSSVAAFACFQYGVRVLGPSVAAMFMYLSPPAGIGMAALFLGEEVALHHLAGLVMILTGVACATGQADRLRLALRRPAGPGDLPPA